VGADAWAAAALEADLDLAGGRAAVAGNGVAVITQLRHDSDAVAATGDAMAWLPGGDAREARLHPQTIGGTTIARLAVAVVACLVPGQLAIATA
jgi:hypothetical protein